MRSLSYTPSLFFIRCLCFSDVVRIFRAWRRGQSGCSEFVLTSRTMGGPSELAFLFPRFG